MTETPQQFIDWFVKNYPGPDTVIFDPKWHAPKIYRAAIAPAYSEITEPYRASLRMIREAVETIFGPAANLESEEAELLRGPEPHHTAEAIIAALQNVASLPRERGEVKEIIAAQVQSVCDWDDRTSPDDYPDHLLITPEELTEILENVVDLATSRIRSCLLDKPEAVEGMCLRTGLPHAYWPQENCQYCGEISPANADTDAAQSELDRLRRELEEARRSLEQQDIDQGIAAILADDAPADPEDLALFDRAIAAAKERLTSRATEARMDLATKESQS